MTSAMTFVFMHWTFDSCGITGNYFHLACNGQSWTCCHHKTSIEFDFVAAPLPCRMVRRLGCYDSWGSLNEDFAVGLTLRSSKNLSDTFSGLLRPWQKKRGYNICLPTSMYYFAVNRFAACYSSCKRKSEGLDVISLNCISHVNGMHPLYQRFLLFFVWIMTPWQILFKRCICKCFPSVELYQYPLLGGSWHLKPIHRFVDH